MPLVLDGTTGVTFPAGGLGNPASDVVGLTDTQTLTNKSVVATQLTGTVAVARLPAGSVLQVVSNTYATQVSSSTNTYVDTGLTATITPTSATSKILVSVSQNGLQKSQNNTYLRIEVLRSSTVIGVPAVTVAYNNGSTTNYTGSVSGDYLDSPATTSATVYKTRFRSENNAAIVSVQGDSEQSTITLMEIAA